MHYVEMQRESSNCSKNVKFKCDIFKQMKPLKSSLRGIQSGSDFTSDVASLLEYMNMQNTATLNDRLGRARNLQR